jgi:hypothetical protein
MPQPISKVASNASISIGNAGDRPLIRHPQLAVLAIEAIASWSNVESFMLHLFIQLFGGNQALATDVFLALEGQGPKAAAIQAAAERVLKDTPERLKLLRAILALVATNQKARDKLAHWIWGDSRNLPDALLLANPKSLLGDLDKDEIFVYKEQDFAQIITANDRLCSFGLLFDFILMDHPANREDRLFVQLCAEPEIREVLDRQNRKA